VKYVFYVNTGDLPKGKALEILKEHKDSAISELGLSDSDKILVISVRDQPTELRVLTFDD
jgi:hypothetical protein